MLNILTGKGSGEGSRAGSQAHPSGRLAGSADPRRLCIPCWRAHAIHMRAECGDAIATHPLVDKVAFTGSTSVGRKIMQGGVPGLPPAGAGYPIDQRRGPASAFVPWAAGLMLTAGLDVPLVLQARLRTSSRWVGLAAAPGAAVAGASTGRCGPNTTAPP